MVVNQRANCVKLKYQTVVVQLTCGTIYGLFTIPNTVNYRVMTGGAQPSVTMEHFIGKVGESLRTVEKLPHNSARAKKLTESIAEFTIRDLRPVSTVDGDGLLNLMEVTDTVIDKMYCKTR